MRKNKQTNKHTIIKDFVRQAQTSQFEKSMFLAHLLTRQHLTLNMHCVFLMSPYCHFVPNSKDVKDNEGYKDVDQRPLFTDATKS